MLFMEWVYPHIARLRRMLRRRGRSIDDCDDLIQDLFVRVLSHCKTGEGVREPERFLANIMRNLATDAFRREHRELYAGSVESMVIADTRYAPDDLASCGESVEQIQAALDSLDERTSQAYLLHRLHGLTYEQIGEQLDMKVRTVENHIARAAIAIAKALQGL
jgi:RNA polymerase sigma factor (sigma-70 family)